MSIYALIDGSGTCVGICQYADDVEHDRLILISSYDEDYLWRKYDPTDDAWSEVKYEPTRPDEPDDIS